MHTMAVAMSKSSDSIFSPPIAIVSRSRKRVERTEILDLAVHGGVQKDAFAARSHYGLAATSCNF